MNKPNNSLKISLEEDNNVELNFKKFKITFEETAKEILYLYDYDEKLKLRTSRINICRIKNRLIQEFKIKMSTFLKVFDNQISICNSCFEIDNPELCKNFIDC